MATQAAIVEALSCFDRALDMRRGLRLTTTLLRYGWRRACSIAGRAGLDCGDAGRMADALGCV